MTDYEKLNVGDVVYLVKIPMSVAMSMPKLRDGPEGFLRVYQRALDKKSRLRITFRDNLGRPWVEYNFRNKKNKYEHHFMLIDDDSYEIFKTKWS